jgi:hypothetical protein
VFERVGQALVDLGRRLDRAVAQRQIESRVHGGHAFVGSTHPGQNVAPQPFRPGDQIGSLAGG